MSVRDTTERTRIINIGTAYQQQYYELLPDWFEHRITDCQYLKQNIGFALFGPPQINTDEEQNPCYIVSCKMNASENSGIVNEIQYDEKSQKAIDAIYNKVMEYGKRTEHDPIYFGVVYNIVFYSQESKKSDSNASHNCSEMCSFPIFKVKKYDTKIRYPPCYTTWYIDSNGRTYKTWKDYIEENTLFKCTMILPKNGFYQSDPSKSVTELHSTVWVESLDSPACAVKKQVVKALDTACNVIGIGTAIGVGVASLVTPIGPILAVTGLATGGVTGLWTIGRCSQQLVNRKQHGESIKPTDKNALSLWFGIASSTLTIGTNGATALLSRSIARGYAVSTVARVAFNSVLIGNLTVSGMGILHQGYCLIEKYKEKRQLDFIDIALFSSHVLFFGNAVFNTKLSNKLIAESQGTVLERFKNSLRSDRLRAEYNRAKSVLCGTQGSVSDDSGIIRMVRMYRNNMEVPGFLRNAFLSTISPIKVKDNNFTLLHPLLFLQRWMMSGMRAINMKVLKEKFVLVSRLGINNMDKLKVLITKILIKYNSKGGSKESIDVNKFDDFLQEINVFPNTKIMVNQIFMIAHAVVRFYLDPKEFIVKGVYFIWDYLKANIVENHANLSPSDTDIYSIVMTIITYINEHVDEFAYELFIAFSSYVLSLKSENEYNSHIYSVP